MYGGSKARQEQGTGVRFGGDFSSWTYGGREVSIGDDPSPGDRGRNRLCRCVSDLSRFGYWNGKGESGGAEKSPASSDRSGGSGAGFLLRGLWERGAAGSI